MSNELEVVLLHECKVIVVHYWRSICGFPKTSLITSSHSCLLFFSNLLRPFLAGWSHVATSSTIMFNSNFKCILYPCTTYINKYSLAAITITFTVQAHMIFQCQLLNVWSKQLAMFGKKSFSLSCLQDQVHLLAQPWGYTAYINAKYIAEVGHDV